MEPESSLNQDSYIFGGTWVADMQNKYQSWQTSQITRLSIIKFLENDKGFDVVRQEIKKSIITGESSPLSHREELSDDGI